MKGLIQERNFIPPRTYVRSAWPRAWKTDVRVLTGAFLSIAFYCYTFSRNRILWSDELFGWMLVRDITWGHMLYAWQQGGDGGGPLFYLACRGWLAIFGHTVLSFRAFSACGCFLGFAAVYLAISTIYRRAIAAAAAACVWMGSTVILWQLIQTRFYGMLLGAAAIVLLLGVLSARRSLPDTRLQLTTIFVANLVLVGTHPFGVVYSAVLLAGAATSDLLEHRRRFAFYIASVAPWSLLLLCIPALRNSAAIGKPHFWTTRPELNDLIGFYQPDAMTWVLPVWLTVLFVLICICACGFKIPRAGSLLALRRRSVLLAPAAALLFTPVAFYIGSQGSTSYFVARYLIPTTLGAAILLAETILRLMDVLQALHSRILTMLCVVAAAGMLCDLGIVALKSYPEEVLLPTYDYTPTLRAELLPNVPFVIERPDIFTVFSAQQPGVETAYLLDQEIAVAPQSPRGLASGYNELHHWQKLGYYSGSIHDYRDFLADTPRFVVLRDDKIRWLDQRIVTDPRFTVRKINHFHYKMDMEGDLYLVERVDRK